MKIGMIIWIVIGIIIGLSIGYLVWSGTVQEEQEVRQGGQSLRKIVEAR